MKTALLIINYNDATTTELLLKNVEAYQCLDLIVVLDNASTDDSFGQLKKYQSDHIHVIQSEGNKGYAYAINFGSNYLIELYQDCNIIVSNSDIVIYQEDDLKKLIDSKREDIAILAPIIKEPDGISRGWKLPTPHRDAVLNIIYLYRLLKERLLNYPDDYYEHKNMVEVDVVLGCFYLIDTRYLKKVGFYDENTFLYYEENIMAKKLMDIHAKTMINCQVEMLHNHSVSIDKSINRLHKLKLLKQSQYYFQVKYQHATLLERFALKLTAKGSYCIFSILYRIH